MEKEEMEMELEINGNLVSLAKVSFLKKSLAIAVMFLMVGVGSAGATDIDTCTVIDSPGVYDITADLTAASGDVCIEIQCGGVILDGHSHSMDGTTPQDGNVGIYAYPSSSGWSENLTIRNVEIKNFCEGISIAGKDSPGLRNWKDILIEDCVIHDNGLGTGEDNTYMGIHLFRVHESTITKCEIYNQSGKGASCTNGGSGIHQYKGDRNNFTCNNIHNNDKGGMFIKGAPKNFNITYNYLWENGEPGHGEAGGIILRCKKCDDGIVAFNNASNNINGNGIFIGGRNNTIRNNIANNNKYGINMGRSDGSYNNKLYENTICRNSGYDIKTCGPECYGNHGDNNTCDTTSYYDDEGTTSCTYMCGAGVIADFFAEQTSGAAPLAVNFTDKSKPEGDMISWLWDFGDGNTSDEQNPVHTYYTTEPYSYYNVSLNVTTSGGDSDTETKTEYIKVWKPEAAPNADFHCEPGVGDPSVPVQFTDKSLEEVTSWLWEFGDGETNTTQNPEHYYSAEGIYNVSLTVTGAGGSSKETKFQCVRVGSGSGEKWPLIDAHFFASARTGNAPFTVTFTDMSRSACEIDSWKWNFGDGNISSEKNPTHRYNNAGTYNVSLEVTNSEDAKAKENKIGYIEVKEEAIFDTGAPANSYPSIFGTHKGKIIPDKNITVNRLYTYPCEGTGGHAEYVRIWNESEAIEGIGRWSGYQGDYHNVTISPIITLLKNHEYNYTIITGSYPQIIHAREHKGMEGGNITCREFIDANGRKYDDWIPAIKLFLW
jgi:PKD repeat protein